LKLLLEASVWSLLQDVEGGAQLLRRIPQDDDEALQLYGGYESSSQPLLFDRQSARGQR
jgi:hypothetical protein